MPRPSQGAGRGVVGEGGSPKFDPPSSPRELVAVEIHADGRVEAMLAGGAVHEIVDADRLLAAIAPGVSPRRAMFLVRRGLVSAGGVRTVNFVEVMLCP